MTKEPNSLGWIYRKVRQKSFSQIVSRIVYWIRQVWFETRQSYSPAQFDDGTFYQCIVCLPEKYTKESLECLDDITRSQIAVELMAHFERRPLRFFFETTDQQALNSLISRNEIARTVSRANAVLTHSFIFRETPFRFRDDVDWNYSANGYRDWTRDLNRLFFFHDLGRAYWYSLEKRYVEKLVDLAEDWTKCNPVHTTVEHWNDVLEVAIRLEALCWAWFYVSAAIARGDIASSRALIVLKLIWQHATYLYEHIEIHNWSNHLVLEAKMLAFVGELFPEFSRAKEWRARGWYYLRRETAAQVRADGVHAEQSTMYHKIITSELTEMCVLYTRNGWESPAWLAEVLVKMLEVEMQFTKPDGSFPVLGDSSLDDLLLRFSTLAVGAVIYDRPDFKYVAEELNGGPNENTKWLLGAAGSSAYQKLAVHIPQSTSAAFPNGGFYVMRSGWDRDASCLMLDGGPFGYERSPAHGHADALSVDVSYAGRSYIVDSGTFDYTIAPQWRSYFRGTSGHNTLRVNEVDQTLLHGAFGAFELARTTQHNWISNPEFDFADISHAGYFSRFGVTHRRQVMFVKHDLWVIRDRVQGSGEHFLELMWHLAPDLLIQPIDGVDKWLLKENSAGVARGLVALLSTRTSLARELIEGEIDPVQGWVSDKFGAKRPATVLRISGVVSLPTEFITVFAGHELPGDPVELENVPITEGDGAVVRVKRGTTESIVAFSDRRGRLCGGPLATEESVAFLNLAPHTSRHH